jgi:hypothetical protein
LIDDDDDDDDVSLPSLSSEWEVTRSTTAPEGASEGVYDIFDHCIRIIP